MPETPKPPAVHDTRRTSGARLESSDRVTLRCDDFITTGWTLNMSRGGVRIVVEDPVEEGRDYAVTIGSEDEEGSLTRRGRVVWVKNAADGQIIGVRFLDVEDGAAPPPE